MSLILTDFFKQDRNNRQWLRLAAKAMTEYCQNKERIMKSLYEATETSTETLSLQLSSMSLTGQVDNFLGTVKFSDFAKALEVGSIYDNETVLVNLLLPGLGWQETRLSIDNFLTSYATDLESATAYGVFFETISKALESGTIDVSGFITACQTKLSNLNSGIIDHLASILKSSTDFGVIMDIVLSEAIQPNTDDLVFDQDAYASSNLFVMTLSSIVTDVADAVSKAFHGISTLGGFISNFGSAIGNAIGYLVQTFIPNLTEDYVLNKVPVGIFDIPLAQFYLNEQDKDAFIYSIGTTSTNYYSAIDLHYGDQYYITASGRNSQTWGVKLTKMFADLDKTGVIEVPVPWGLIRAFKNAGKYYFYLYSANEGPSIYWKDTNSLNPEQQESLAGLNTLVSKASDNESVCDFVLECLSNLSYYISHWPVRTRKPIYNPNATNKLVWWSSLDPSNYNEYTRDEILQDVFLNVHILAEDDYEPDNFYAAIKNKRSYPTVDIDLNDIKVFNGKDTIDTINSILARFIIFQLMWIDTTGWEQMATDTGENPFKIDYSTSGLDDFYPGDQSTFFSESGFVPYYTYAQAPVYVHAQTAIERANEIKTYVYAVIVAAAAVVASVTLFKVRKKVIRKVWEKKLVAQQKWNDLIYTDANSPQFQEQLGSFIKSNRVANIWSRLAGMSGQATASIFSGDGLSSGSNNDLLYNIISAIQG